MTRRRLFLRFALGFSLFASCVRAADLIAEPGTPLVIGENDSAWKPLFTAMAAQGAVYAQFTEFRWFPFRKEPTELTGEMRLSPSLGLSLHYAAPDDSTMIVDDEGLMQRTSGGRNRIAPDNPRYTGLTAALLPVMRFDLPALDRKFTVAAVRNSEAWRLDFTPRDAELAKTFGRITVQGEGTAVRRLEFRRDAKQRIEIIVSAAQPGATFTEADVKKFFR
jgi:hypothetical protein